MLTEEQVVSILMDEDEDEDEDEGGTVPKYKRYFHKENELFHVGGNIYLLSNQWGVKTLEVVDLLSKTFPELGISVSTT